MSGDAWTIGRVVRWTTDHFRERGILTPGLDAELIVAHALDTDRVGLLIHSKKPLNTPERERIKELIRRRLDGEPVAYITGEKEFWGMKLEVTPDVLVPRPETEEIVEEAMTLLRDRKFESLKMADLGTGSGCIAAGLCAVFPAATVVAVDISDSAAGVARRNLERHGFIDRVAIRVGSFFDALDDGDGPFELIVSNPPYVPVSQIAGLAPEVRSETRIALDGGDDGLDHVRHIVSTAARHMASGGVLLIEIGAGQGEEMAELDAPGLEFLGLRPDLAGIDRVAKWRK